MIKKIRITEHTKKVDECDGCDSAESQNWNSGPDHEGRMAKSELKGLIKNAVQLHNMLGTNDELPGWVSEYIALSSDYIHSVTEYLEGITPTANNTSY